MLFGSCNCMTRPSSFSRRSLLRAGGASFVSALVSTMIGSGRTAQAKTLSEAVPEVDRLSVRIVTDIMVRRNVPSEKPDGRTGGTERDSGRSAADHPRWRVGTLDAC